MEESKGKDKMIVSDISTKRAQDIYTEESSSAWRVLRYLQTHPKACRQTNARTIVKGIMLSTRGEGAESSLNCKISSLVKKGVILKVNVAGAGKGQRADYVINYFHPELPSGLFDLAPEEDKKRVQDKLNEATKNGGAVDKFGAITVVDESVKQEQEDDGTEDREEVQIEQKSDTIKENLVTVKQTEKGLELTINLNISINGAR